MSEPVEPPTDDTASSANAVTVPGLTAGGATPGATSTGAAPSGGATPGAASTGTGSAVQEHAFHDSSELTTELAKEGLTMALYVAICLLAALAATSESFAEAHMFEIIWGTTLGLALAHWFAFRVSARLVAAGPVRRHDALAAGAQLIGAFVVAALATLPVLIFRDSLELEAAEFTLSAFIGLIGYSVARTSGGTRWRSIVYAAGLLVAASAVVVLKLLLSGH
jgi:hypothetical protein